MTQATELVGSMTYIQLFANISKMALYLVVDAPVQHIGVEEEWSWFDGLAGMGAQIASGMATWVPLDSDITPDFVTMDQPYEVPLREPPLVPIRRHPWTQLLRNCIHDSLFWQNFSTFALSFFIM